MTTTPTTDDLAYRAWVVIANAMDRIDDPEWRAAAIRWRDDWHAQAEAAAAALLALRAEVEEMSDPWAQSDGRPDKVSVARVLAAIDRIAKAEPDAFEAAIENAEPWRFPAKAEPEGSPTTRDYMCPNCVTPWKCNGPHIPEGESRGD